MLSPEATATATREIDSSTRCSRRARNSVVASSTMTGDPGRQRLGALEVVEREVGVAVGDVQNADLAQRDVRTRRSPNTST